jgi:alkanesulfonate monooxygenase SsuD/methylene tetrahydromethanopterin reductase-like flavin-dependent oxidoreductase (luciferase family)
MFEVRGSVYPVRNNALLPPPGQLPARRVFQFGERPFGPAAAAGLDFRIIPAGFNTPPVESLWVERLEFLTGFT